MTIRRGPLHLCAAPMCERMVNTNQYCRVHLKRLNTTGSIDMLAPIRRKGLTAKELVDDYSVPVPESGCWLWTGGVGAAGYGTISYGGRKVTGHRLAYEAYRGEIPNGLWVLHKCDVRSCVNPEHLFLGTAQDNTDDMLSKKRNKQPKGENAGRAILTAVQVLEIRRLNLSLSKIAGMYGVAKSTIRAIKNRQSWAHV